MFSCRKLVSFCCQSFSSIIWCRMKRFSTCLLNPKLSGHMPKQSLEVKEIYILSPKDLTKEKVVGEQGFFDNLKKSWMLGDLHACMCVCVCACFWSTVDLTKGSRTPRLASTCRNTFGLAGNLPAGRIHLLSLFRCRMSIVLKSCVCQAGWVLFQMV
ncbi:hypothetical protein NVIE_019180 [Nitrososphaera viennensis EN76]|uniref:Uncharacterized protein n=1 Tax=Nitrososphaera viennensis EN76 TaxID=926571 RepID=A0A060HRL4_9ARCH|nr:hypothetical protein NVIE_019180 [Nitrososphaera viennensis EN76]